MTESALIRSSPLVHYMTASTMTWTSSPCDSKCNDMNQFTMWQQVQNDMNELTMWQQVQWQELIHRVTSSAMTWTSSLCDNRCNVKNRFTMWQQMQWENPVHHVTASAVREARSPSDSKCNERSHHWVTELLHDRRSQRKNQLALWHCSKHWTPKHHSSTKSR